MKVSFETFGGEELSAADKASLAAMTGGGAGEEELSNLGLSVVRGGAGGVKPRTEVRLRRPQRSETKM
jgi:hypothetical protein